MLPVLSVLIIILISIVITKIATVALVFTGLSRDTARFQALSAFVGAGFTTSESESVVTHPVRRRIVYILMMLGNAGIVTVVSSLILSFIGQDTGHSLTWRLSVLGIGIVTLAILGSNRWVDKSLSRITEWAVSRFTDLNIHDYAALLDLEGEFKICEIVIEPIEWLAGKKLADAKLRDEGVIVLAVKRNNDEFIGAPRGYTQILEGDTLVLYGRDQALKSLVSRRRDPTGDAEHQRAVEEARRVR